MRTLIVLLVMIFVFPGCYTQLATMESALPATEPTIMIDSTTGDTVKVIKQVDTIINRERETCVWERDMFGRPYLQCYDSYYPRSWFSYNNTPWWYRNDPYWYDYNRCPRYYRYDPSCGCCQYYDDYRYRGGFYGSSGHHDDHYTSGGSSHSGTGSSGSTSSRSSSSSGSPITGSSSRTHVQKAPAQVQQQSPPSRSVQKAAEPSATVQQPQPAQPPSGGNSNDESKKRTSRTLRSR